MRFLRVIAVVCLMVGAAFGVTVTPFSNGKPQFFNGSTPCNGCKLYTYAAGTTTPQATYTDSTGNVANANPVVMDSSGYADIWMALQSYKFVLKTSADVTIWTQDNIKSPLVNPITSGTFTIANSANNGLALTVAETGTGATTAIQTQVSSASGIGIQAWGTGGGQLFSGLNSSGVEKFSVSNAGLVVATGGLNAGASTLGVTTTDNLSVNIGQTFRIAGGTALTTTNQTGTGNLVLATAPGISAPAITGNMTYASTTPVANLHASPVVYNGTGTQQVGLHWVYADTTLVSGTPSTVTITLSGSAVFTNSGSYRCWASQMTTAADGVKFTYTDGSHFVITGPNTVTDSLTYWCLGN